MSDYRTFVVPYDFSEHARAALFAAVDLARRLTADLHLVHVIRSPSYAYSYAPHAGGVAPPPVVFPDMKRVREDATRALREVAAGLEGMPGQVGVRVVEGSGIADLIREVADALDADLIVMGTHGRTGLAHVFLGSVTERTLRSAPCPVLVVQAPREKVDEPADER